MKIGINALPGEPISLKNYSLKMSHKCNYLEEKFRLAQHKQLGKSSEGYSGQGELFNEVEELIAESEIEQANAEKELLTNERNLFVNLYRKTCFARLLFTTWHRKIRVAMTAAMN